VAVDVEAAADCFPAFCCLANLLEQPQRVLKTVLQVMVSSRHHMITPSYPVDFTSLQLDEASLGHLFTFWEAQFARTLPRLA
jgi:hypothetical protein